MSGGTSEWGLVSNAIQTKLVADATLVSLLGHTSTAPKIFDVFPEGEIPKKVLAYQIISSRPIATDVTHVQKMVIDFSSFSTTRQSSIAIVDRLSYLIHNPNVSNRAYWDFSDDNVKCHGCRYLTRLTEDYDPKLERHFQGIRVEAIVDPYTACS